MQPPTEIREAARHRAEQTREKRQRDVETALMGYSIQQDRNRKNRLEWYMNELQASSEAALALDQGKDPTTLGLPLDKVCIARAVQRTSDLRPIEFLEKAREAARGVGRFVPTGPSGAGTFFMISRDLLITNHHVIGTPEKALELQAEFNFEVDAAGRARTLTRYALEPGMLFIPNPELDFTVVALGRHLTGPTDIGVCPLVTPNQVHGVDTFANIIQHPGRARKQIVFRENRVVCSPPRYVVYTADTLDGASGSPVFNDDWKVIALHHSSTKLRPFQIHAAFLVQDTYNEGIDVTFIVQALRAKLTDGSLTEHQVILLRRALAIP
jgi:endonuclease G